MGILATYVLARTPLNAQGVPQRLVELTNPDIVEAVAVNTTQLLLAETDVVSEFNLLTGVAFDTLGTSAQSAVQLAVAYYGMISKLMDLKGLPRSQAAKAARDEWISLCQRYDKLFGSHAVQSPLTDATAIPTPDPGGSLPYFDRRVLGSFIPRSPYPSSDSVWPGYPQ